MRPNPLQRRGSAPAARRRHSRRLVLEPLESRVVPSTIDFSGGFANHSTLTANGTAGFNGSLAVLTNGGQNQAGSIFTNSKVDISHFTADFTFTMGNGSNSGGGLAFVIQGGSPTALGTSGLGLGFSGIPKVFGVTFYLGGDSGAPPNSTGTTPGVSTNIQGLDLHAKDKFEASLSYDGSTLHETLKDLTTGATFSHDFGPINIVSIVGSQTAFVGFSGGTGTLTSAATIQTFLGTLGNGQPTPGLTATGVPTINGVEGQVLHYVTLATFTGGPSSTPTATINWGDGTTDAGIVTGPDSNGVFTVHGNHTYAEEGTPPHGGPYVITVTITSGSSTATVTDNTNIVEAPLSATPGSNITTTAGQSFTAAVATFTNAGGPEQLSDYSATINWGDNTTSTGTISLSGNVFTVTGSHAYATAGTFTITTTISHETASPVTVTITAVVSSIAPPMVPPANQNAVEGQATTFILGTFTSTPAGFPLTITVNWGDNTSNTVFNFTGGTLAATHTYAEESTFHAPNGQFYVVTVTATNIFGQSTTQSFNVFVSEAPLIASGVNTISAAAGQSFTAAVATFVNTGGPENPNDTGDYNATINWGDNTSSSGTISLSGNVFKVTGSHTYASTGTFTISTTINHETAPPVTARTTVVVSSIAPPMIPPNTQTAVEGQSATFILGTFSSTPIGLPLTITVNWGDNTSNTVFNFTGGTLAATHTYAEESKFHANGAYTVTVTATNVFGQSTTQTFFVVVSEAPLVASGVNTITAAAGQSFTAPVATFIDTGSPENPNDTGDYNATINWGDNTTSSGTISLSGNTFTVTGSHTYGSTGTFTITTTITHEEVSATARTTVVVSSIAPPMIPPNTQTAVEGQSATFILGTFSQTPTGLPLTITVNWGDNTSNTVFNFTGGTLTASHTYAEESKFHANGAYTVTVTATNVFGQSTTQTFFVVVSEAPLVATGLTINGVEGQAFTAPVATFVDTGGSENASDPGDYSATINWDDGTTSDGTISGPDSNGVFTVTGSHSYTEEVNSVHGGPFNVTVTITHEEVSATASSTAVIAEAPLAATGGFTISATQGQAFTTTVATFVDTGGSENASDPGDYNATIDWGDGTTSAGTISGPDSNGVFTVTGTQTYASTGTFNVTVTINHETTSAVVTDTASVGVADLPLAGTAMNVSATQFEAADMVVAQFTDADLNAQPGNFTATIDWGDGTSLDTGTVTQPGGPGTPFFVDFTHGFNDTGTFSVHVNVLDNGGVGDSGGAFVDIFSTATVSGAGAPQAPGGRSSAAAGNNLLAANAAQATPQQLASGTLVANSSLVSTPILSSTSVQSSNSSDDLYWQLVARGEQPADSIGLATDQLALALGGTA